MITPYHAKLFAHEISKRHSVADAEKLAGTLLDAQVDLNPHQVSQSIRKTIESRRKAILNELAQRQAAWFDDEMEKLDHWADDKRAGLKADLKELDDQIKELKKEVRQTGNLPDKLALRRKVKVLEAKRDEAWRGYDEAAKEIEIQKDTLLDQVEERLGQEVSEEELFTIRFCVQ